MLVALVVAALVFAAASCSKCEPVAAVSGDKLASGTAYSADLDGDGASEQVLIKGSPASLTITDGDTVYHSRDKWQVVEASLGDTDHDGLLEVVTLLDDEEGRHLGLFAYFGGEYRERLVTQELSPRPLSLEIVNLEEQAAEGNPEILVTLSGDLVVLTEEPAPGESGIQTTTYRWNGFGFTRVGSGASQ